MRCGKQILPTSKSKVGAVLFVNSTLYIPAVIDHDVITPISKDDEGKMDVVDDIISVLIEENVKYGEEVVFVSGDQLKIYNGLVLIIRDKK